MVNKDTFVGFSEGDRPNLTPLDPPLCRTSYRLATTKKRKEKSVKNKQQSNSRHPFKNMLTQGFTGDDW